ncbi:DNA polymerase III subunit chi [Rhizobium alvei]|uniref:DNA polymerase III subunit chi n=1 Tax=Rhizobium alvei TaxID=1132659 RepID=A0ABT8YK66_9HYPH|nr:DNA polymerase III subunit chi [Rhizobium alvei]MDO6963684.1 DNA polymerase III subunit chi [Rhizobium alvei]
MDILFYHLTETRVDEALPALLEKCLERSWRVVVQTISADRCAAIDGLLWTYRQDSFLPHGTDADEAAAAQPVLLTAGPDNANSASVRFLIDGAQPPELEGYQRIVFMFDGHDDEQVQAARQHWKRLKADGNTLSYWQQNQDGRWEKKA